MDITIQNKQQEPQKIALVMNNVEFCVIAKSLSDFCEIVKDHLIQKAGVNNIQEVEQIKLNYEENCYLTAGIIVEKIVKTMREAESSIARIQQEEVQALVDKNLAC
jgi:hypothetical protein